jgi:uncharacterized protein (DUF2235 family)
MVKEDNIKGKNIVVCCDGTGNEYGERNTSVIKLFHVIRKEPGRQVAYYDPGVGTSAAPAALTRTAKSITRFVGLAFAYGMTKNIEDAYEYLMDKYEEGDRVFLFGFSRGAFTVRAMAGMLHKCGLLEKGSTNLIPYASKIYKHGSSSVAKGFKNTFSRECKPHFIGVWDTVKSVGLIIPRKFPNAVLNPDVKFGRQALAIDEKRSKFRPNLWEESENNNQRIMQVWFAGFHSDVAGSHREAGLPNIALKWMVDEAEKCGLLIDKKVYREIKTDYKDRVHNSLFPLWWLLGWKSRKIKEGSFVHGSVYKRIKDIKSYKPKNLPSKEKMRIVS